MDFQSIALPTELRNRCSIGYQQEYLPVKSNAKIRYKASYFQIYLQLFSKKGKKSAKKGKKVAKTA
jgi:hypothetical protein